MNDEYTLAEVVPSEFQADIAAWAVMVFGEEIAKNQKTRVARFLEEAVELAQALQLSDEDILKVVEYVLGRPVGVPYQEVGGVMVTLAALCEAQEIDMIMAGQVEQGRCERPEVMAKIRAKQANKPNPRDVLPAQHPDDVAVTEFAAAMRDKMKKSREEKGRGGWEHASPTYLRSLLHGHVVKGDPVDVANLAMMLWHLGASTADEQPEWYRKFDAGTDTLAVCQDALWYAWLLLSASMGEQARAGNARSVYNAWRHVSDAIKERSLVYRWRRPEDMSFSEFHLGKPYQGDEPPLVKLSEPGEPLRIGPVEALDDQPRLTSDGAAMVNPKTKWKKITPETPRSAKFQLINKAAGVAHYGTIAGTGDFYTHYHELPVFDEDEE